jgi:hypothetical protein
LIDFDKKARRKKRWVFLYFASMMMDIEQFAGIRLGPGTLYGAITRLEARGWIKPVAQPFQGSTFFNDN